MSLGGRAGRSAGRGLPRAGRRRNALTGAASVVVVAGLLAAVPAAVAAPAPTSDDVGVQHTNDLEVVRKRLQEKQKLTEQEARRATELLKELHDLDTRLLSSSRKRHELQAEEEQLERGLREHQAKIETLESERAKARALLRRRLASIYKQGRLGSTRVLEQAAASAEPIRMARYLAAISKADTTAMREYEQLRRRHEQALAELHAKKQELEKKKEALRREAAKYEVARKEKAALLARLQKDLEKHRTEAEKLRAAEEDLISIINLAPPPEVPPPSSPKEPEVREARVRPPVRRERERPFGMRKGELAAPVRGEVILRFGDRREGGPREQGIVIRAAPGSEVTAVASGEVRFAGPFPGLGNMIILAHGQRYHTVYAHLVEMTREVGDRVLEGEPVGRLPDDDPLLHFELRAEGKPLDPAAWLRGGYAAFAE